MSSIKEIKSQLKENNAAVLKKLGQNFLVSQAALAKIIAAADLKPQDTVLEIGPGLGELTFELAKKVKKVIAVEKDRKISAILEKNLAEKGIFNVEVVNEDILVPPRPSAWGRGVGRKRYKLVANLPYNIATAVIMKFLDPAFAKAPAGEETQTSKPDLMVVMVQKEVAQRIVAKPPRMNKLAIFCQLYSEPKIIGYVPPTAFYPKPKVFSAILQLTPKPPSGFGNLGRSHSVAFISQFQQIVNAGFSHPRKTLLNNFLKKTEGPSFRWGSSPAGSREKIIEWLKKNNVNPMQRPETLSVENWQNLAKTFPFPQKRNKGQ